MALQASRDEIPALNIAGVCLHLGSIFDTKKHVPYRILYSQCTVLVMEPVDSTVCFEQINLILTLYITLLIIDEGFQICFLLAIDLSPGGSLGGLVGYIVLRLVS